MYKRDLSKLLLKALDFYPIVTLTGPRQSGKTTLVKEVFPEYDYYNLEDPDILEQIQTDPKAFLLTNISGMIIDEVQNFPKLLSYIQVLVDEKAKKFVLTGSHQFSLLAAINQSLAGRTDLLTLYPLSVRELHQANINIELNHILVNGFYPRIYDSKIPAARNSKNYIKTYVERDVRKIINIKNIAQFTKFIKICATRVGQELNINSICNEIGSSNNTVKEWLSLLEASYIIYLLKPYYKNFGKRVVKSPKLYFVDVGLASYLLGITDFGHIQSHPLRGNLFENMVIMELVKYRANLGKESNLYFYRDNNQNEVDAIWEDGANLVPLGIKSSTTFNKSFLKGINYFMKLTGGAKKGALIYAGKPIKMNSDVSILGYEDLHQIFGLTK